MNANLTVGATYIHTAYGVCRFSGLVTVSGVPCRRFSFADGHVYEPTDRELRLVPVPATAELAPTKLTDRTWMERLISRLA